MILLTHTVLAIVIVPLILVTLYRAWRQNFEPHKKIARWTWPLWMYVSVTGVVVYLLSFSAAYPNMHRHFPPVSKIQVASVAEKQSPLHTHQ